MRATKQRITANGEAGACVQNGVLGGTLHAHGVPDSLLFFHRHNGRTLGYEPWHMGFQDSWFPDLYINLDNMMR